MDRQGTGETVFEQGIPGCFRVESVLDVPYLGLVARRFRHTCGLEAVCVECPDAENTFIAGFRTANCGDTGVQHILEHVVLGGSRNYQVKSPCDEMERCSLVTYVNGETYQDRTLYPFSSLNESEFLNGVGVYLDAVFNPLLLHEAFMQEGWRYEPRMSGGRCTGIKATGIVLNERLAQMNDIGDVALTMAYRELLPGHPLSFDAGGTPGVVETLSYRDFVDYYRAHYGLNQCKLYFYGSIPSWKKLSVVQKYLETHCGDRLFAQEPAEIPVPEVVPWLRPRSRTIRIESGGDGVDDGVCSVSLNWHLGRLAEPREALGFEMLSLLLLEDDSSPLRRAMLESGLCEDMLDLDEYETEHGECLFIVGAYGGAQADVAKIRRLCLDCLGKCARDGFTEKQLKAAFNQMQLRYREIPNGYGLTLGRQVMRNWLSGLEPMLALDYRKELDGLRRALDEDSRFFQKMIQRLLLDNRHRVDICYIEDASLAERRRRREARRLGRLWRAMAEPAKAQVQKDMASFLAYQSQDDTPEALEAFPRLKRCELPDVPCDPPVERRVLENGIVLVRGDVPSPGVNNLKLAYDAGIFTLDELKLLPVFTSLVDALGAGGARYGAFEQKLAVAGAEMEVDTQLDVAETPDSPLRGTVCIKMDGLAENWKAALECLEKRCRATDFRERSRVRDVLAQCLSQANQKLVSEDDALEYATWRSGAGISMRETWNELWYGVCGVRTLAECVALSRKDMPSLEGRLAAMMEKLRGASPKIVSYVGDDAGYDALSGWLGKFGLVGDWGSMPSVELDGAVGRREGIDNGRGAFCCVRSFRTIGYDDPLWAPMSVYGELLGEGYLMDSIRTLGGAYGGGCSYSPVNRMFQMMSYRDPNPAQTLEVFRRAPGYCRDWTDGQVTGGIVGCIRGDTPLRAGECCNVALWRELIALAGETRAQRRRQLLAVTLRDVRQAAEALAEHASGGWNDCIIGERRRIAEMGFGLTGWK